MSQPIVTQFEPVELPSKYAKAIVAIAIAVLTAVAAVTSDGTVSSVELAHVALAFVTAVGVYGVPNAPSGARAYAKAGVAVVGTGLQVLIPFLLDGALTPSQWLLVLVAAIGALGVGITPNVETVQEITPEFDAYERGDSYDDGDTLFSSSQGESVDPEALRRVLGDTPPF